MKIAAAEAHRIISDTYGKTTHSLISDRTCREWFQRFKSGDFAVEDRHSGGREKVVENAELEAILSENSCQTQEELSDLLIINQQAISKRLKQLGMIQKEGYWVPHELKPRDVERRLFACEQLLERQTRKGFLHRIVITPSAENHGDCPVILLRQHLGRISMTQKSCFAFGWTS